MLALLDDGTAAAPMGTELLDGKSSGP